MIRQTEAAECGLACLTMVARHHGQDIDLATLRRRFPVSIKGSTLKSIMEIGSAIGLGSRAVRCEPDDLSDLKLPAILHWGMNHFVVLKRVRGNRLVILDPDAGERRLTLGECSGFFTGVALELTPTDQFERKRDRQILKLSTLVRLSGSTVGVLVQAIVLSLVIEAFVLATPFYMQLVIDEVVLKGDADLLTALAVGFAGLAIFSVAATVMRALTLQHLSITLGFSMGANVFHHLIRLPLDWFHKRHTGDIQSRFRSLLPIQQFISNGAVTALLDGVMSLATLALMFLYAPVLAGVVVASVAIYTAVRIASLGISRRVAGDYLINDAKEQTRFLETLRGAQTLKLAAAEPQRENLQRNAMAATLKSGQRAAHVNIGFQAVSQVLSGLTDILVVFLAARAILSAEMTVGMLTAFMAYKGQFSGRVISFVENIINWRLLDVQLERLADIALTPREPRIEDAETGGELIGHIEARRLVFRYSPGDPEILKGASF
ncbi:MAG TPA: ABC transporter transmembrane domain-containing protein, partial [Brevundimonas sp.]